MRDRAEACRGGLLGLAVGDAMGYTVDDRSWDEIRRDYGPNGLMGYDLVNGYADVTSYTQIAAFTANALLLGITRGQMRGVMGPYVRYIALGLREWARGQRYRAVPEPGYCWLSAHRELCARRCMDTLLLDTLQKEKLGSLEEPVNRYCAPGVLTVAVPVGLFADGVRAGQPEIDRLAAEAVALTHGSPGAFLPAAVLAHLISDTASDGTDGWTDRVKRAMSAVQAQFGREYPQTAELWELLRMATTMAGADRIAPAEAMEQLRCRTGGEVLAGAVYACLVSGGDFDAALITAVNHSGRSAAVGAVTGALLGTQLGEGALPEFYLECLEPAPMLRELASDLARGCPMARDSGLFDDAWDEKYNPRLG